MKRFLCFLLTLSMLFCAVSASATDAIPVDQYAANNSLNTSDAFLENSYAAAVAYTNFIMALNNVQSSSATNAATARSFGDDTDGYKVNGIGSGGYPDYYAGAYVNIYGNLVVLMDASQSHARTISATAELQALAQSDDIVIGYAEYTYNQLIDVMSEILVYQESVIENKIKEPYYITGFGIDDFANRVVVYINSTDAPAKEWFRENVADSAAVEFVQQNIYSESTSSANYGDAISCSGTFSIGFRAKYTSSTGDVVKGFVTCGHSLVSKGNATIYYNGQSFGVADSSRVQFYNGGYADAAFVRLNDDSTVNPKVTTNTGITYSISTTGGWILPPQHSNVYMYGQKSASEYGSVRVGEIDLVSYTAPVDTDGDGIADVYLNDQVQTSYISLRGDSGGVVFALSSGTFYVSGIQSGRCVDDEGNFYFSYYSKALNFMDTFGLSLY